MAKIDKFTDDDYRKRLIRSVAKEPTPQGDGATKEVKKSIAVTPAQRKLPRQLPISMRTWKI